MQTTKKIVCVFVCVKSSHNQTNNTKINHSDTQRALGDFDSTLPVVWCAAVWSVHAINRLVIRLRLL